MSIFYPVQIFSDWLVYSLVGLDPVTHAAESLNFFVFDTIKIFLLLVAVIFVVAFLRSYLPPEKVRSFLAHRHPLVANILAASFGIVTPFCTCSAIPLFLGFVQAGVPLGATFSYLVASPMVNEVALILLYGMFGWKIALLYATSGVIIAVLSGLFIGRLNAEHLLEDFVLRNRTVKDVKLPEMTIRRRLEMSWRYVLEIVGKVWPYIIVGVGLGALIHGYVPADFLARYAGADRWYAVPLATVLGIPLYSNAAGVVPLMKVLTDKGVAVGTVLAFMMAVTALSLPEFMILRKIMKPKLIIIFATTVGAGIMLTGYLFNAVI